MSEIPECFYRVSVKALVLNENRDKFLIMQEDNGWWDLPGGGLDWGTLPQDDVVREIDEEMALKVKSVSDKPLYFYTNGKPRKSNPELSIWYAYVLYEVELEDLDFFPSDECVAIDFVDIDSLPKENVHLQVTHLADLFDPKNHT
ncbi:MAG: 8-oxo-dGTP diphosphatase [Patiriisocius sp.]|jgi:8-oxo-dGTP diphosphatase